MKRSIEASTTVQIPPAQAGAILVDDPGRVVADEPTDEHRRARRFPSALGVGLGAGREVQQEVVVELGNVTTSDDGATTVPLHWRATGHDRLFPVFDGELEASANGTDASLLTVRGVYTVPLGPVGRFGDGVIGRRLARQSLTAFVEGLARRLDREAHRRSAAVSWHPEPYAVTLHETASEHEPG